MKRVTKICSIMLIAALIISILPAIRTEAAEKKYKLALTGEYDLNDFTKADYQYTKTLKTVKLEKVEGKNQWNLTMYAGTAVELSVSAADTVSSVDVTSKSDYLDVDYYESQGVIWIDAEDLGQKKILTNKVITCKAYNKTKKCLSTLKIVVKILPYNAKLERKTPATADELYKLGYLKSDYSNFAWEYVISRYQEYLVYRASVFSSRYECPETLDIEMKNTIYRATGEVFIEGKYDLSLYEVSNKDCEAVQKILDSLELNQYKTDWEKILAVQKWVKKNIKYEVQSDPSVVGTLERGNGDCDCYANLMNTACRLLGIPCYVVVGSMYTPNDHAWNIVLIDGMWCTMDLTGQYLGFGVVDCRNFKNEPSLAAYEELQPVFGGKAYLFGDDLPDEVERLVHLYQFRIGEHRKLLLEDYKEWLERKYDSTIHEDNTFKYWFREYRLTNEWGIDNHPWYNEWLQNEYDPKVHEGDPLEYWYIHVSDTSCYDCSFIVEYFPEELDAMEAEAAQWRE